MNLARVALVVLMAVALAGAVYGAAASFTVSSTDLGAGDDVVAACDGDTLISISFGPVAWEPAIDAYKITTVTVSGIDQNNPPPKCKNAHFRLQLTTTGGVAFGDEVDDNDINTATSIQFDFSDQNLKAEDVEDVHMALYGP